MLLGALAGAIPVIIHLINRQRAKLLPFAAIEFLLLTDKRLARRLKLKQLLVLLLRVALLLAIAFALAKPFVAPDVAAAPEVSAPGAVVLVIDDSASMGALHPDGSTLIERAVSAARRLIEGGGDRTSFAVVTASRPARVLTPTLTYDHSVAERALARVEVTPRAGDMAGALREAERLLADSTEPTRRVIVISDQSAHAWAGVVEPWALERIPQAELVDVRAGAAIDNLAITGVTVRPAPDAGPGQVEIVVTVANHGAAAAKRAVKVRVAGRVFAGQLEVPPRGTATKAFVQALQLDAISRGVATLDDDALAIDNTWHFTVDFSGAVTVGVVNGAPRAIPFLDELFFLLPALNPEGAEASRIRPVVVAPEDLGGRSLASFDVLVLANVGRLSSAQQMVVKAFVEDGGGLLVAAGDQLTPQSAGSFGELLPFPVRAIKAVVDPDDPAADLRALRVANVDFEHPAMRDFALLEDASLFKARIYEYALVETARRPGARVVASFTGGIPALVEGQVGRGTTMLLTTTVDRDWTDLPMRTSFLPLVQQLALYLAGDLDGDRGAVAAVGDVVTVRAPQGQGALTLERPDGATVSLGDAAGERLQIDETDVVGHYVVRRGAPTRGHAAAFTINADRAESDLTPAAPAEIAQLLERPGAGSALASAAQEEPDALSAASTSPNRTNLWPPVLVMLFVLLASEAWLVIRG